LGVPSLFTLYLKYLSQQLCQSRDVRGVTGFFGMGKVPGELGVPIKIKEPYAIGLVEPTRESQHIQMTYKTGNKKF
jgi:hypothetical protein